VVIKLVNVSKSFGPVAALRDVTLEIGRGELVLLSGPSGAGKTTLLRTLFAATRPDSGYVLLGGRDIARLPRSATPELRRRVGVVFQDFKLLGSRTAAQNVAIALQVRGLSPRQVRERSLLALSAVGLEDRAGTRVACLSGGEQQRVAIARAMAGSPSVLLADEPTGNLDPDRSNDILDLLELEARRGTTVVIATHDPMVVQNAAASRVVLMEKGTVVGSLAEAPAPVEPSTSPADKTTPVTPLGLEPAEVPA
jgi:cell division transport system ATP-binding protein